MMQAVQRKRGVSSCIPCYTRKQKVYFQAAPSFPIDQVYIFGLTHSPIQCNRRYPCNHCTQRRRPEQCAYYQATQAASRPLQTDNGQEEIMQSGDDQANRRDSHESLGTLPDSRDIRSPTTSQEPSSLAELFGYFEDSKSNTMALLRRVSGS